MPNLITGDTSVVNNANTAYLDYESGLKMSFIGTNGDTLTVHGSNAQIVGTANTNLHIDLTGFNGLPAQNELLNFGFVRGVMQITDFTRSDVLALRYTGFRDGQAMYNTLVNDGHGGSVLNLGAGNSIHFVHSDLTAASFAAIHT